MPRSPQTTPPTTTFVDTGYLLVSRDARGPQLDLLFRVGLILNAAESTKGDVGLLPLTLFADWEKFWALQRAARSVRLSSAEILFTLPSPLREEAALFPRTDNKRAARKLDIAARIPETGRREVLHRESRSCWWLN
jgi:hypothetical protein